MLLETVFIGVVVAYLHKRVKFSFIKHKKPNLIIKGAESFFIDKKSKIGILLLHGFTSTPQEVKGLGAYLAKKGYTIYAPLLTGHGTHVFDLARTKKDDWENSAKKALKKLKEKTKEVYIIGSSFGGNIALKIATEKKVKGIILMGTPMFFKKDFSKKLTIRILGLFKNFIKKRYDEKVKKVIKKKINYMQIPIKSLNEVAKVIKESEKILPLIKIPTLIMQSSTDHILPKENAELIYKKLGSKIKEKIFIPNSYHVFCIDKNKNIAFKKIAEFIKKNK